MELLLSVKSLSVGIVIAAVFTACFVSSFSFWYLQHHGPSNELPTISQTFMYYPGNVISRVSFNIGCIGLVIIVTIHHFANETNRHFNKCTNLILYVCALIGITSLNLVGVVCMAPYKPECEGSFFGHFFFATLNFVFLDVYLFIETQLNVDGTAKKFHALVMFLKVVSKVRFLIPLINHTHTFNFLSYFAVFECTDVACIIILIFSYTYVHCSNVFIHLIDAGAGTDVVEETYRRHNGIVRWVFSLKHLIQLSTSVYYTAIGIALFFYMIAGTSNHDNAGFPKIDDLWIHKPSNWVSRYAANAPLILNFAHVGMYFIYAGEERGAVAKCMLVLSCVASLGLTLAMCINEAEQKWLHDLGNVTFYSLYDVFMVYVAYASFRKHQVLPASHLDLEQQQQQQPKKTALLDDPAEHAPPRAAEHAPPLSHRSLWMVVLAALLSKLRWFHASLALLEWLNALAISAFAIVFTLVHVHRAKDIQYRLVAVPREEYLLLPAGQ